MTSFVSFQGGSQTATLYFDAAITSISAVDVTFTPDPGITSVTLSSDSQSARVAFTTAATPGASYTVAVASSVSTPPLSNTTLTLPLVFGSEASFDDQVKNGDFVRGPDVFQANQGQSQAQNGAVVDVQQVTYYLMRAYNTATSSYVWWTVSNSPDFTGARSAYAPANLTDIVLDQTICT